MPSADKCETFKTICIFICYLTHLASHTQKPFAAGHRSLLGHIDMTSLTIKSTAALMKYNRPTFIRKFQKFIINTLLYKVLIRGQHLYGSCLNSSKYSLLIFS